MDQPVLLTGAGGRVGQAILGHIGEAYDWRLLDREPLSDEKIPASVDSTDVYVADVTDETAVRNAMDGVHAVIHLAGDPRPEAPWDSVLRNNIDGTQKMFDAAVDAGVEKFVFASSNHAVGAYETDERTPEMYRTNHEFRLDGTELPRPSNLYGVSKATGETLGRYYHDHHDLSVVNVRIGNLTQHHPPKEYERGQAMWLSYRDCGHLFECCIEADYDYEIVYGISDNDRKYYSIDRAREVLGYDPTDNSAEFTFEGEPLDEA
ncbi:NAD(P)-dependent oxidoreductase [Haloferax mediterranei ATCC 33500]|uniref:NAD-dependent glucose-6-phosphate dehydrogenase n=1 Tax=Haloferax mediterranei (strain ATCC 33500 / DSM 1411 / JCM 8866 / NBRC 14739 / NCIMB 2177 / R-4) TaxID=523841 RepID=I3R1V7_HALMT|nr:NAD-dependent glucose-6-phosphate dehydrogenase [Haloferax mediterranei]AFK18217.1 NAD-dependent epimerase/dehydratase [Haloferax mediterranei ATCC 33500]AHZ22380.1 NAD-dependent epimerase [Haloferax mediterranei ATCC 33500]EMA02510.1 NAD-dependent epimerase/dehydratase [Haloferax mediterranei ATCC 33500]MDX5988306.1 NAD-dependent glucose-6-phosphate dehydrogenase [Haloferax mediterranei ATCC 33500]QCQ74741.1 NAD(P)-dependent oxidoreductase [Haloferax mediterranei ATCC 33500]